MLIKIVSEIGQRGIVVTSSFPDAEYLHWPAENLELRILRDGTVRATGLNALTALEKVFSAANPKSCAAPMNTAIRYSRMSEIK